MDRPSWAMIMSSVSTKQRPRRRARMRPTEDFPAPMKPTRITLSDMTPTIVSPALAGTLPAHGDRGGRPPIGAAAHPAAAALGEVVVHPRGRPYSDEKGDALPRRHHARLVEDDADGLARAQREERRLLGGVPARVARADAVGHLDPGGYGRLAEEIVGVLSETLHRGRAHAV